MLCLIAYVSYSLTFNFCPAFPTYNPHRQSQKWQWPTDSAPGSCTALFSPEEFLFYGRRCVTVDLSLTWKPGFLRPRLSRQVWGTAVWLSVWFYCRLLSEESCWKKGRIISLELSIYSPVKYIYWGVRDMGSIFKIPIFMMPWILFVPMMVILLGDTMVAEQDFGASRLRQTSPTVTWGPGCLPHVVLDGSRNYFITPCV